MSATFSSHDRTDTQAPAKEVGLVHIVLQAVAFDPVDDVDQRQVAVLAGADRAVMIVVEHQVRDEQEIVAVELVVGMVGLDDLIDGVTALGGMVRQEDRALHRVAGIDHALADIVMMKRPA